MYASLTNDQPLNENLESPPFGNCWDQGSLGESKAPWNSGPAGTMGDLLKLTLRSITQNPEDTYSKYIFILVISRQLQKYKLRIEDLNGFLSKKLFLNLFIKSLLKFHCRHVKLDIMHLAKDLMNHSFQLFFHCLFMNSIILFQTAFYEI